MCKKGWIVFGLITVLFCGILVRLGHIAQTQPAKVAAAQNRWTVSVATSRGTIYDRNRHPLVNEHKAYFAAVTPIETVLAAVRDATTGERFMSLRTQLEKGHPAAVRLTKPIGFMQGMRLFYLPVRYSERLLAPHVIGYLDSGGQHGVCGIEQGYDELLTTYNGKATATFTVDGAGRFLAGVQPQIENTTARSIGGIVLTLDREIQKTVEDIGCEHLKKGAVIIYEAQTGNILSMASFPDYQPDTIEDSIQANSGALINRALSLYDCGSVFKIVTAAAALEKSIPRETAIECPGYVDVDGTRFHCHNRLGHGRLTMTEAFAQSCNVYFIELAQQVGAQTVYQIAQKLGLQQPITVAGSITASSSLLPELSLLQVSAAALANFSFGQGYLLTSPLHVAQLTSTIVNNGEFVPLTLLGGVMDEAGVYTVIERDRGEQIISPTTSAAVRDMMTAVVEYGTGQAARPDGISAAGKTGTAETGQVNDAGNRVVQSWFTGYYPADHPQYGITILAEDAEQNAVKSTVVFKKIVDLLWSDNNAR